MVPGSPKIFVAVAGNIGSGKTTLTRLLSERFGWQPHYETVADNPYLEDFYKDMERWSFPLQIFFLNHRFSAHRSIAAGSESAIQDRSIYEDANIFARNLVESGQMQRRDYENYLSLYRTMISLLPPPDLMLYLHKSLPKLRERIAERGRSYERSISDTYLLSLNRSYDEWMAEYSLGKKLIIESDGLDFIHKAEDFDKLSQTLLNALEQPDFFLSLK